MNVKKLGAAVFTGVATLATWEFFVKPKLKTILQGNQNDA
jgi:hypothetical protein